MKVERADYGIVLWLQVMRLILNIIFGGMMTVSLLIHYDVPFHFMVSISDEY